jgi:gliding motility-associated-like protein
VQAMKDFITERCTAIQEGLVDCYTLTGPYDVVYKVDPPLSGDIHINSVTPDAYPFEGIYYGGITTTLEAEGAEGWVFDRWETLHHVLAPGMTDSLATLQITTTDTIIAHFRPPIKYDIVLMVDPPNTGTISYDQTLYSALPATVQVLPESVDTVTAHPNMYYDFLYWEFKHNLPNSNDTTALSLAVTIFEPDTIIAHLAPQDYVYFGPNAFTPNGDNINDVWRPFNNVVDLENYDLRVYDRWGREVFASEDPYRDWDGTFAGSKVPGGVYAFKAFVMEALTRKRHDVVGHVTVVR